MAAAKIVGHRPWTMKLGGVRADATGHFNNHRSFDIFANGDDCLDTIKALADKFGIYFIPCKGGKWKPFLVPGFEPTCIELAVGQMALHVNKTEQNKTVNFT